MNLREQNHPDAIESTETAPCSQPAMTRTNETVVVESAIDTRLCDHETPKQRPYELHIICQTHWDREWRLPFQQTRLMLVDMMDHLLEAMSRDPALRCFHLDGQTILLEDYVELRPEKRAALADLVAQGRLLIGPWYTLPEENLVCGESLVRNLLMGHRIGREFGGIMKVGFTPSSYGQVAQIPQIYNGFGMDTILFHRGVPAHEVDVEYLWEGSDGSRLLALRPPLGGRFNFTSLVTSPLFASRDRGPDTCIPYHEIPSDDLFHAIGLKGDRNDIYYSSRIPANWDKEVLRRAVQRLKKSAVLKSRTPCLYCGEGHDWMELNPMLPALVAEVESLLEGDKVMISSLPDLFARIRATLVNPTVLKGEMRCTQKDESGARLYASTLSSRMPLKQANRRAEDALIRWAEPFSVLASLQGAAYPDSALRKAWRYLLANHAHDSISGTGTDQVHADVMSRFVQCELIAAELTRRSLSRIVSDIDDPRLNAGDVLLTVFNPLPYARDEVLHLDLDLPEADESGFRLCDAWGNDVPYHAEPPERIIHTVQQTHAFPYRFSARRHRLWIRAEVLPAMGYVTYVARKGSYASPSKVGNAEADRVDVKSPHRMENRFVAVQIHADGSFTVQDKRTGRSYENLHFYEDDGEVGDAYEHRAPPQDKTITSLRGEATIELVHHNPLTASFVVRTTLSIPECAIRDKTTRSSRYTSCDIYSTVTLTAGSPLVQIVTRVNNAARDHRLRVLFPTNLRTNECWAETAFDVQKRTLARSDVKDWLEPPCATQPQLGFVDVSEGDAGLAIFSYGLPEYEIIEDGRSTIAITLLRCFTHETRATRTDDPDQIGAQCPGQHEFQYAIFPHEGDWRKGKVFGQAHRYHYRPKVIQSWRPVRKERCPETLPLRSSFLEIVSEDLILSAVKRSEDGRLLVVRCFNPTEERLEAELHIYRDLADAWYLDLEENLLGKCPLNGKRSVRILAGPKKIVTIGLEVAP